jgi:hypothetical protein
MVKNIARYVRELVKSKLTDILGLVIPNILHAIIATEQE